MCHQLSRRQYNDNIRKQRNVNNSDVSPLSHRIYITQHILDKPAERTRTKIKAEAARGRFIRALYLCGVYSADSLVSQEEYMWAREREEL